LRLEALTLVLDGRARRSVEPADATTARRGGLSAVKRSRSGGGVHHRTPKQTLEATEQLLMDNASAVSVTYRAGTRAP
jgi:hypothetical protein